MLYFKNKTHLYLLLLTLSIPSLLWSQSGKYAFQENKGQWNEKVKFRAITNGGHLYLENNAFHYQFENKPDKHSHTEASDHQNKKTEGHIFRAEFVKSNPRVQIKKLNASPEYFNYYLGNDKSKWAHSVHNYSELLYEELYTGINLRLYQQEGFLKYDYILKPNADVKQILIEYKGVKQPQIKDGHLIIRHQLGKLIEEKPYAYQIIEGKKSEVPCNYAFNEKGQLNFNFPEGYDKNLELIIDPVLIFSTYSGSAAGNFGMTATYDKLGNGYMGGVIFSSGYITTLGAYSRVYKGGDSDITISKFSSDGSQLIYSTYLGGVYSETVHSMIVDDSLNLIIMGVSSSPNFPTTANAYDRIKDTSQTIYISRMSENFETGPDIIITKFNSTGTAIKASTFFGGDDADGLNINKTNLSSSNTALLFNYGDQFRGEITLDSIGNIYIGSVTYSKGLGQGNDTLKGGQDGIVAKFSPDLQNLIWSKYLGGLTYDAIYSIKILNNGNVLVGGGTKSVTDFPTTPGSYQPVGFIGNTDGFVSIISADGQTILKSTFVGTTNYDQVYFVEFDRFGGIYVLGQSIGGQMPIKNSKIADTLAGQFIIKFDPNLDSIVYATTFGDGGTGGQINISPTAFLVDQCQNVYASGWGGNLDGGIKRLTNQMPITANAYRSTTNNVDFYLYVMSRNADTLLYASFFGGTSSADHVDGGTSRFDKRGIIYQSVCASCATGPQVSDFPTTPNSYFPSKNITVSGNDCNNALFKFDFEILPKAKIISSKQVVCAPAVVNIKDSSKNAEELIWDFYGTSSRTQNLDTNILFSVPGFYTIKQIARDTICNSFDSTFIIIEVQANDITYQSIPDIITCDTNQINLIALTNQSANEFLWSTNPQFTDTINSINDSILSVKPTFISKTIYLKIQKTGSLCYVLDTIKVQYIPLFANSSIDADTICEGNVANFTSNFSNAQHFVWYFGNGVLDSVHLNPQIRYNNSGDYIIQVIVSNSSCADPDTNTLKLNVQANQLQIESIPDSIYCGTDTITFSLNSYGTAKTFLWSSNANYSDTLNHFPNDSNIQFYTNTNINLHQKITDRYCTSVNDFQFQYEKYKVDLAAIPDSMCSPFNLQVNSSQIGVNSFKFDFGNGSQNTSTTNPTVNYVDSGTFIISLVTKNIICKVSDTLRDTIRIEKQVNISPIADTSICFGDSIVLKGNTSGSGEKFYWSKFQNFVNPLNDIKDSTIKISPKQPNTIYYFKAEKSICKDSTSVQVTSQIIDVDVDDYNSICIGDTISLFAYNNSPYFLNYLWENNAAIIGNRNRNQLLISPLTSMYFYLKSNSAIGCLDFDTAFVEVNQPAFNDALIFASSDSIYEGQNTQLSTNRTGGNLSYFWEPATGLSNPTIANPVVNPSITTLYKVTITDNNTGCKVIAYKRIFVLEINCAEPDIFIPSAFTPNQDGQNDVFRVRGVFLESLNLQIFNRWGEKVFESNDVNQGWDGSYKGELANPGVFVYHLKSTCLNGQEFFKKGNITLIR
ncbi:MAG: hypothetical protein DWP98_02910 [Bacteroidetes bacterium]|nr:MAG: hypothetical protein DWP98_02910 [Bacteroidota bacterium]MBL1144287.1 hypothetical protein [Bacteroidota bacterium]NOG57084.1 T9SS type B sorting domain-containing protein [Bacteroidota bacterium]